MYAIVIKIQIWSKKHLRYKVGDKLERMKEIFIRKCLFIDLKSKIFLSDLCSEISQFLK